MDASQAVSEVRDQSPSAPATSRMWGWTALAVFWLLASGCEGTPAWLEYDPYILNFDLDEDSSAIYIHCATSIDHGDYTSTFKWSVSSSEPWITVTPAEGTLSASDDSRFIHKVRVAKNLPAGLHQGFLTFTGKRHREANGRYDTSEDEDLSHRIDVRSLTGSLIQDYHIESNTELDSLFDCSDDNRASGADYWGVIDFSGFRTIWCNERGKEYNLAGQWLFQYTDNMDAWMILKSQHAVATVGYERVHIGLMSRSKTESTDDYVEAVILDSDARVKYSERLAGQAMQSLADWTIQGIPSEADLGSGRIRFGFHFHSDSYAASGRRPFGTTLYDLKVFGDAAQ